MDYKVIRKSGLKHMYLRVDNDLGVIVKANEHMSLKRIDEFVNQKEKWIRVRLARIQDKSEREVLASGCTLFYIGDEYKLVLSLGDSSESVIYAKDKKIIIETTNHPDSKEINDLLDYFYKQKAIHLVSEINARWSEVMGLYPNKISFRKVKTRWGSCNVKNNISYNIELIKLPVDLIDYVVVHELSHIVHKNHSHQFWSFVELYIPDYLLRRKKMRKLEKKIFF